MSNINSKIKIFLILGIAFIGAEIISKSVFLAGTPRLNTSFFLALKNAPRNFLASFGQKQTVTYAQKTALQKLEQLPVTALNQMGTGVYAQEDKKNNVVYIKITKDAQWEEKTIIMDGKEIKVRFPKEMLK